MQINISVRHGHISEATREKIAAKAEKLSRFFDRLTSIDVTVNLEHEDTPWVEVLARAEHKHDFVANDTSGSLLATLESVIHKVEQQIKKHKTKIKGRRVQGAGEASTNHSPNIELDENVDVELEGEFE